jgi:tetratricopeptide (TPR) repeat protein
MTDTVDRNKAVYKLAAQPFILERQGDYDEAIQIYKTAIEILDELTMRFKKGSEIRKINRKMFERQVQVHRERLAYLEGLKLKGNFDGIILPPTILDAMEEVEKENGKTWTLTQVSHTCNPRDLASRFTYTRYCADPQRPPCFPRGYSE